MPLQRYSSRTRALHKAVLSPILKGAVGYDRIAGYFRSSILSLVGEELKGIPRVRIVCNSDLDLTDLRSVTGDRKLLAKWHEGGNSVIEFQNQPRYRQLVELLDAGNVEIRVVAREEVFVHGKAGVVRYADGRAVSFVGSVNETYSAWADNYEIVWTDDTPESAAWVEEEFEELWKIAVPLPDVVVKEIRRLAVREEITIEGIKDAKDLPRAALGETPIYQAGEILQVWQRSFIIKFLDHRERYGKARLLLADEVGVGKTLSMAGSAVMTALLGDGPVLILAPASLCVQWQVEMMDKLGVPTAMWTREKSWCDVNGHRLTPERQVKAIEQCPCRIGIISTGLIMHQYSRKGVKSHCETDLLLKKRGGFGLVILDEAHKARGQNDRGTRRDNNLLRFMKEIGKRTKHLILGTATPIQTAREDYWDLMRILASGTEHVLGDAASRWRDVEATWPILTSERSAWEIEPAELWDWVRNPLPKAEEDIVSQTLRQELRMEDKHDVSSTSYYDMEGDSIFTDALERCKKDHLLRTSPMLRFTVLRKRSQLEKMGLLQRVGVELHPSALYRSQYEYDFIEDTVPTQNEFDLAYEAACDFCKSLKQKRSCAGFLKVLMLKRICSSYEAGLRTAQRMLEGRIEEEQALSESEADKTIEEEEEESETKGISLSSDEKEYLRTIIDCLSSNRQKDGKLALIRKFLTEVHTGSGQDRRTWLEHGCIIFSQYYDTASWLAEELSKSLPNIDVGLYAGAGKSRLYRNGNSIAAEREELKQRVNRGNGTGDAIHLMVATDAACEGLNLQKLGTLINCDLPWNPSRLEQRLGRIKRFGQNRNTVDVLNLVYQDTVDEQVYKALSSRMQDIYDLFGSLPETLVDDWTASAEDIRERIDQYIHERKENTDAFTLESNESLDVNANRWEECSRVLSRRDFVKLLNQGWNKS